MECHLHESSPPCEEMILSMRGKFTHRDYAAFLSATEQVTSSGTRRFVMDMNGLESIDSGGVGMLLMALDVARRKGIGIEIRNARGRAMLALGQNHLDELFELA